MILLEMIKQYNIIPLAHQGKVIVQINRGMYGIHQADYIVYDKLTIHLAKGDYIHTGRTPGLFKYKTLTI